MNQERLKKMNALLKEIVWVCIYEKTIEIQSDFWLITVNDVKLATDMSYLDVFVSSIKNSDKLCKTLAWFAQDVKEEINKKITLRKTPIIRFRYNDEMEFATDLISKINSLEIN
jgi:ribosome-binding factor A